MFVSSSRILFPISAVWFIKPLEKNGPKPQGAVLAVAVHPHSELVNEEWKGLGQQWDNGHPHG